MKRPAALIGVGLLSFSLTAGIGLSSASASTHHSTKHRVTNDCRLAVEGFQVLEGYYNQALQQGAAAVEEVGPAAQAGEDQSTTEIDIVTGALQNIENKLQSISSQVQSLKPAVQEEASNCLAGK